MTLDTKRSLGLNPDGTAVAADRRQLIRYINLKLAALGRPTAGNAGETAFLDVAHDLLAQYQEYRRLLDDYLCPADQRIQDFLDEHLAGEPLNGPIRLPARTFVARPPRPRPRAVAAVDGDDVTERAARELPRPQRRAAQPQERPPHDRRASSTSPRAGCRSPATRWRCRRRVFARAVPPRRRTRRPSCCALPFTADQAEPARAVRLAAAAAARLPGGARRLPAARRWRSASSRPAAWSSNLDFVESIFGNAGDPYLPENDAGLDVEHWTGHTGCVILAPHLTAADARRTLGLPHVGRRHRRASARDGMCWRDRGRAVQRRPGVQGHLPRRARA